MTKGWNPVVREALAAGLVAAITGGIPSTAWALLRGQDPLEATRAAGTMLVDPQSPAPALYAAAVCVHVAVSLFWAAVLAASLPRRRTVAAAIVAAGVIAVLDLRVIGALFPSIQALAFGPQFADHLAWGASVGLVLAFMRRRQRR
jgi:hypothetical protein